MLGRPNRIIALLLVHLVAFPPMTGLAQGADGGKEKPVSEWTMEELQSELKNLEDELKRLDGDVMAKYVTADWRNYVNMGLFGLIFATPIIARIWKEARDLKNDEVKKEWDLAQLKKLQETIRARVEQQKQLADEMRNFVKTFDEHVDTLPELVERLAPKDLTLQAAVREALDDWHGRNKAKKRSRVKLDQLLAREFFKTGDAAEWKGYLELFDLQLAENHIAMYKFDQAILNELREKVPQLPVNPLHEVKPEDKETPGQLRVDPNLAFRQARRAFHPEVSYEGALARPEEMCHIAVAGVRGDVAAVRRIRYFALWAPFALQGAFVASGIAARVHYTKHTETVDRVKDSKKLLEEAKAKKQMQLDEAAKDLLTQIASAKGDEKKALDRFQGIVAKTLKKHKDDFRKAITKAFEKEPDWEDRQKAMEEALKLVDRPETLRKLADTALGETFKAMSEKYQLPQVIETLRKLPKDADMQKTEFYTTMVSFYGRLLNKVFTQLSPDKRLFSTDAGNGHMSWFAFKPTVDETISLLAGADLPAADPGTVAPTPVTPAKPTTTPGGTATGAGAKAPGPGDGAMGGAVGGGNNGIGGAVGGGNGNAAVPAAGPVGALPGVAATTLVVASPPGGTPVRKVPPDASSVKVVGPAVPSTLFPVSPPIVPGMGK